MANQGDKNGKPRPTASELLDRQLAATAAHKQGRDEKPTREEAAALRRIEKAEEEEQRWVYYRSISQKHWREMSGRDRRTIVSQAEKYGIPFGGKTIDLPAVVRALHSFLAKYSHKLTDKDPLMCGGDSPALERYRLARAQMVELELEERRGDLIRRDRLREGLARYARGVRAAGDSLLRQFGKDAHALLDEHLDDAERDALEYIGTLDDSLIPADGPGEQK